MSLAARNNTDWTAGLSSTSPKKNNHHQNPCIILTTSLLQTSSLCLSLSLFLFPPLCPFVVFSFTCMSHSCSQDDGAAAGDQQQPQDAGWVKKLFGSDVDRNANLQPGFVPHKSDFNVPCDGLPASVLKSRKTGRSIR